MKNIILILCICVLFSCKSKTPKPEKESDKLTELDITNKEEYIDIIGLFKKEELNYKPRYDPPLRSAASEKYANDYDDNGYYTTKSLVEASRSKIGWNKGFKNE